MPLRHKEMVAYKNVQQYKLKLKEIKKEKGKYVAVLYQDHIQNMKQYHE